MKKLSQNQKTIKIKVKRKFKLCYLTMNNLIHRYLRSRIIKIANA